MYSIIDFMDNKSESMLLRLSTKFRIILWSIVVFCTLVFLWAYFFEINQFIRVEGKVIPSKKTQVIQNLEGGIVSEVYVNEGDYVEKGDVLLKLNDTSASTKLDELNLKISSLRAKVMRLKSQSNGTVFDYNMTDDEFFNNSLYNERELYKKNQLLQEQELKIAKTNLYEKELELETNNIKLRGLKKTLQLIQEEFDFKKALHDDNLAPKIDFNLVQQKLSEAEQKVSNVESSILHTKVLIQKNKEEIVRIRRKFQQKSMQELTDVEKDLLHFQKLSVEREDIVSRRVVKSHIKGIINQVLVNTLGQIVKSGEDMIKITPVSDVLIIECKVRPSDIAFLNAEQEAVVRFSSYDFAIYGSLKGKVVKISADTIEDKIDKQYYYTAHVQTYKSYLGNESNKLFIMPGMLATVDVVGEKRTLLNYILKPILRAKQNFYSQR